MFKDGVLVVVGHMAYNRTKGKDGLWRGYFGGAGYHVAMAAAELIPGRVVLVSNCGNDFPINNLIDKGVMVDGVVVEKQKTDCFEIEEDKNDQRSFRSEGEIGEKVSLIGRQLDWENVKWVHLSTAPVKLHEKWIKELISLRYKGKISADSFEVFVKSDPEGVVEVFKKCNLVFVNEAEWQGIRDYFDNWSPEEMVLKLGSRGARFLKNGQLYFKVSVKKVKKVIDTTGAGETVAGVFLAERLKGCGDLRSLKQACFQASRKVAGLIQ